MPSDAPFIIGRADDVDLQVTDGRVSRRHLGLTVTDTGIVLEPLGANPSFLGDRPITRMEIRNAASIRLADAVNGPLVTIAPAASKLPVVSSVTTPVPPTAPRAAASSPAPGGVLRIGRAPDNDLVLADLLVSNHHAELHRTSDGTWELRDLSSRNGTFVNGRVSTRTLLTHGDHVLIGNQRLRFAAGRLSTATDMSVDDPPAITVEQLSVVVDDDLKLLDDVSFTLPKGGLLAILGTTGAGKSTLLKALTGFQPPSAGRVLYDGQDFYRCFDALRSSLGYVPQDDILHPQLTVRTALNFGAELRFSPEVSEAERRQRVEEVIAELGLSERADLPIERLSGGQRKRTSVALELLTKPSVLYLDEPTSGLDPGYEKSVMTTLRTLADGGRAVVVVTHSVASLHLCDRVLILAPGGKVAFFGTPGDALAYFGADDFADIFHALEHDRSIDWKGRFSHRAAPAAVRPVRERPPAAVVPPSPQRWTAQVKTLCRRQIAVLAADRRNLLFLLAEMLIPALLLLALVGGGSLDPANPNAAHDGRILLGALAVASVAIGAANSLREIVKETPIYLRERAAGLMRTSYLVSKIIVLGGITTLQVSALVLISGARANGPQDAVALGIPIVELMFVISLAALGAVALGLLLSAVVSTSEKAMSLIAVIFIVQWMFSGVAVDLQTKPALQPIAYTMSANWGMAAAGSTADLYRIIGPGCEEPERVPESPTPAKTSTTKSTTGAPPSCDARWAHSFGTWFTSVLAMILLTTLLLWGTGMALERKEPVKSNVPEPSPLRRAREAIGAKIAGDRRAR